MLRFNKLFILKKIYQKFNHIIEKILITEKNNLFYQIDFFMLAMLKKNDILNSIIRIFLSLMFYQLINAKALNFYELFYFNVNILMLDKYHQSNL